MGSVPAATIANSIPADLVIHWAVGFLQDRGCPYPDTGLLEQTTEIPHCILIPGTLRCKMGSPEFGPGVACFNKRPPCLALRKTQGQAGWDPEKLLFNTTWGPHNNFTVLAWLHGPIKGAGAI